MDMISEGGHIARQVAAHNASTAAPGEYLTFRLGEEEYGIDLLKVQEIRSYQPPTRIANAPAFIKGVLNLRGVIMPVVDLRMALGCASFQYDASTVVIVLNVCQRLVGVVVDSVDEVLELGPEAIQPTPEMASAEGTDFIQGIATVHQRTLLVLDIEALMVRKLHGGSV